MGKASRNRQQRRAQGSGPQWVAVGAGRDAQRRREHTVRNFAGNPFLQAHEIERVRTAIGDWMATMVSHSVSEQAARELAQEAVLAALGVRPPYSDLSRIAGQLLEQDLQTLATGDLFVVSPSMLEVTAAAAQTLTSADVATLTADDLPALHGLLVLPRALLVRGLGGVLSDVRAFAWRPSEVFLGSPPQWATGVVITELLDADGPVRSISFNEARAVAKVNGHPLPLLFPDGRYGLRADAYAVAADDEWRATELELQRTRNHYLAETVEDARGDFNRNDTEVSAEYAGGTIDDLNLDFATRFMFAFWRLCQQQVTAVTRYGDEPEAGNARSKIADTRIVRLRTQDTTMAPTGIRRERAYKHRWVVRMHKVRQWYPSLGTHKVIWRGPYTKGPDGAPMLYTETIHALVR